MCWKRERMGRRRILTSSLETYRTSRTLCAVAVVAALSTSRSTLAPAVPTPPLRPGSVRRLDRSAAASSSSRYEEQEKRERNGEKLTESRQLVREGQEEKDHRHRPYEVPQDRQQEVQQRLPAGRSQGCPWPHRKHRHRRINEKKHPK